MNASAHMLRYRVFGGVLEAPFAFPELRVASGEGPTDWRLLVGERVAGREATVLGDEELAAGIKATLSRTSDGLRLVLDDTGTFDVDHDGRELTWYPAPGCDPDLVRLDILGRVLALAAHERGLLCLHGSGVAINEGGVGFLAPKGSGKSTLALALAARGARLLTDDTLPVVPKLGLASPGVHSFRLWNDAAQRFSSLGHFRVGYSEKLTFDDLPDTLLRHEPVPLAALYELIPLSGLEQGEPVAARRRLVAGHAAVTLMQHSKLGALLGGGESRRIFERAVELASAVPIYRLEVARDLARVAEVAETIERWHA